MKIPKITRVVIHSAISELLAPEAKQRGLSLVGFINLILHDHVHGVRTVGAKSLVPKPKKEYVGDKRKAEVAAASWAAMYEGLAREWKKYNPTYYMLFCLGSKQPSRAAFAVIYPDYNPETYFVRGTDDILPEWEADREFLYGTYLDEMRRQLSGPGYHPTYAEGVIPIVKRNYDERGNKLR